MARRWRDPQGRPHHKSSAEGRRPGARCKLKRAKHIGGTALVDNSRETLAEPRNIVAPLRHPQPAAAPLLNYASMLDVHLVPRLGTSDCADLIPNPSVRCARRSQERHWRSSNPEDARLIAEHPRARRRVATYGLQSGTGGPEAEPAPNRVVRPLPPQTIESMRAHLLDRIPAARRNTDRGARLRRTASRRSPRPALDDIGERTILVERSVAFASSSRPKPDRHGPSGCWRHSPSPLRRGGRRPHARRLPILSSPRPTARHRWRTDSQLAQTCLRRAADAAGVPPRGHTTFATVFRPPDRRR